MKFLLLILLCSPFIWYGHIVYVTFSTGCFPKYMYESKKAHKQCINYYKKLREDDENEE